MPSVAVPGKSRATRKKRAEKKTPFVTKLHEILLKEELHDILDYSPEGHSFVIHKQEEFTNDVLPQFFKHCRLRSFTRQLNLYGFRKCWNLEKTEYKHPFFIRGREDLHNLIKRRASKEADPFVLNQPAYDNLTNNSGYYGGVASNEMNMMPSQPLINPSSMPIGNMQQHYAYPNIAYPSAPYEASYSFDEADELPFGMLEDENLPATSTAKQDQSSESPPPPTTTTTQDTKMMNEDDLEPLETSVQTTSVSSSDDDMSEMSEIISRHKCSSKYAEIYNQGLSKFLSNSTGMLQRQGNKAGGDEAPPRNAQRMAAEESLDIRQVFESDDEVNYDEDSSPRNDSHHHRQDASSSSSVDTRTLESDSSSPLQHSSQHSLALELTSSHGATYVHEMTTTAGSTINQQQQHASALRIHDKCQALKYELEAMMSRVTEEPLPQVYVSLLSSVNETLDATK